MDKIIYVTCPGCGGEYYLERADYQGRPEAPCHCPFCAREFLVREGNPRPPVTAASA